MPEGECVARIPDGQTGVHLNSPLLVSWGITPQELETKATELVNARQGFDEEPHTIETNTTGSLCAVMNLLTIDPHIVYLPHG